MKKRTSWAWLMWAWFAVPALALEYGPALGPGSDEGATSV